MLLCELVRQCQRITADEYQPHSIHTMFTHGRRACKQTDANMDMASGHSHSRTNRSSVDQSPIVRAQPRAITSCYSRHPYGLLPTGRQQSFYGLYNLLVLAASPFSRALFF